MVKDKDAECNAKTEKMARRHDRQLDNLNRKHSKEKKQMQSKHANEIKVIPMQLYRQRVQRHCQLCQGTRG